MIFSRRGKCNFSRRNGTANIFFPTGRDGTVKTSFHDRTERTYHGTASACPNVRCTYTIQCMLAVVAVVVRHWIIGSKQLLFQRKKRKKTLGRTVRMHTEIHLEIGIPGKAKSPRITPRTRIIHIVLVQYRANNLIIMHASSI